MQFLRHGEGMDFWSTFVATLERSQAALEDFDSAVASARRVFELFRESCLAAAAH